MSQQYFGRKLKILLSKAGIDNIHRFSPHCLRAGGACDLFLDGVPVDLIKKLGRWLSDSFLRYLKVSNADVIQKI